MRGCIITISALGVVFGGPAQALTCSQQAKICVSKGGSPAACQRSVASCRKTGIYVGSNGSRWSTNGNPNDRQKGQPPLR
jgi:hypothetical protein